MSWTDTAIWMDPAAGGSTSGGPAVQADPTPVLDATIGGANSNSYVTLAEADAYFDGSMHNTDWNNHSDAKKEAALIQATQWLDYLGWSGDCCGTTQRLRWPRKNVKCMCQEATCTMIPLQVKQATFELAFKLVHDPDAISGGVKGNGAATGPVKRNKLGDLEQEFFEPANGDDSKIPVTGPVVLQIYPFLVDMLGCWLSGGYGKSRILARVRS